MKGSTGRSTPGSNSSASSRTEQALQSSLNAQPFIPDQRAPSPSPSQGDIRGGVHPYASAAVTARSAGFVANRNTKLSLVNVNAAPFIPGNSQQEQTRSLSTLQGPAQGSGGRGYLGSSQGTAWALPDGDDLLGLSAHTPGQSLQSPATPVQDGQLDRAAADTATTQSAPYSPARGYTSVYQEQAGGGRGRGRGRQPPTNSPARAAPSPDRGSPAAYGRGPGRGLPQRRGIWLAVAAIETWFAGGNDAGPVPAYGLPTGQAQLMQLHFMKDQLRQELQQRSFLSHAQAERRPEEFGLPEMVQQYHSLVPLEDLQAAAEQPSGAFGAGPSQALLSSGQEAVEMWRGVSHHPGLICPRAAFVSHEVGSRPALYFVHDHMPGAVTLEQGHMQPQAGPAGLQRAHAAEQQLWSYLTQIAMALRAAHTAGLAVGAPGLAATKVLLTSRSTQRIKIGSIGVVHVLKGMRGRREDTAVQQQEDIAAVGSLMVRLAGGAANGPALQALAGHLSPHLLHLLASLQNSHIRDCHMLCSAVHEHSLEILEGQMMQQEALMSQLALELDNGRLLRLLARLVMVSEGSQTSLEPNWSETGDRYLIKLFKDFVFHQVNEAGGPLLDWGHVVEALNKLDLGVNEKIMLLSRDEMSMLVVSYADVKQCVNTTFKELEMRASRRHD
ncbi:hypothetical protein ABBQ38_007127 [Trebouxia sp. C0009 RCD-2024]